MVVEKSDLGFLTGDLPLHPSLEVFRISSLFLVSWCVTSTWLREHLIHPVSFLLSTLNIKIHSGIVSFIIYLIISIPSSFSVIFLWTPIRQTLEFELSQSFLNITCPFSHIYYLFLFLFYTLRSWVPTLNWLFLIWAMICLISQSPFFFSIPFSWHPFLFPFMWHSSAFVRGYYLFLFWNYLCGIISRVNFSLCFVFTWSFSAIPQAVMTGRLWFSVQISGKDHGRLTESSVYMGTWIFTFGISLLCSKHCVPIMSKVSQIPPY